MNRKMIAKELLKLAKELEAKTNFKSAEDFVDYVEDTLGPDLRSSGMTETAKDFYKAVKLIKMGRVDRSFIGFLKRTLIPDLEEDGRDATVEDLEEAIYWIEDQSYGE